MKKFQNGKNILKEAGILIIVSILLSSNFFTSAQTIDNLPSNVYTNELMQYESSDSSYSSVLRVIFWEDFENEIIPPTTNGKQWTNTSISPQSWFIDNTDPADNKSCATVKRGNNIGPMDERLITPRLDFSSNKEVNLKFKWYTSRYAAYDFNFIDLNVSIAVDNDQNWTWLWNENSESNFWSWKWYTCELDLTDYAAKKANVWLCFQFNSWSEDNADIQEYSIDTVKISVDINETTDFRCDCGPDEEVSWSYNCNMGIKFEGRASGGNPGTPVNYSWEWNFDDNTSEKVEQFPTHKFPNIGVYNVKLTVTDKDNLETYDTKTIIVNETPPSDVKVIIWSLSPVGITFEVRNIGILNVTQISWYAEVIWAMGTQINKITGKNISYLKSGTRKVKTVWSPLFLFMQGPIEVRVHIQPFNRDPDEYARKGGKIGPMIFFL